MLSGTARSEGVAKLRAKNGALFQAGSEQVKGMIFVAENHQGGFGSIIFQNQHVSLKDHLEEEMNGVQPGIVQD